MKVTSSGSRRGGGGGGEVKVGEVKRDSGRRDGGDTGGWIGVGREDAFGMFNGGRTGRGRGE